MKRHLVCAFAAAILLAVAPGAEAQFPPRESTPVTPPPADSGALPAAPAPPSPGAAAPPAPGSQPPAGFAAAAALKTGTHIGVTTCGATSCHGDVNRPRGSSVAGNEYLIWSSKDKHHNSFAVLQTPPALRIAKALGLPDAASQKLCLDCHADNAAANARGPQYHIEDGVGCEACHGGASGWLGTHISGLPRQTNIANGMYPTDQPIARAEKCLSCHFGDRERFVDHRFYSAGHPRLAFELDTFTQSQPAHFTLDARYIERKGNITDVKVWAVGQAVALSRRMDALTDPKHAPRGMWPEFAFLDCQTCHHIFGTIPGGASGRFTLDDSNALMVKLIATRIAPDAAQSLGQHLGVLQKATNGNWSGVQQEAAAIRDIAEKLKQVFADHDYTAEDTRALADALTALGKTNRQFSHAEQITMGLKAVGASQRASGAALPPHGEIVDKAQKAAEAAPDVPNNALGNLQGAVRQ
jgi:hypothetical protein